MFERPRTDFLIAQGSVLIGAGSIFNIAGSLSMKSYSILMALLVGTLFPFVAHAERRGTRVDLWKSQLGPFDWKVRPTPQPDGTVHFHIILTILPTWPAVSLTHGPSATLSEASFNSDHYQIVKDLRQLKLTIVGNSALCDFSVTKEELKDPNICFAISLWEKEKEKHADFALLNDFFDFPTSALARLADTKAKDRHRIAEKLARACSLAQSEVDWKKYVPSLIPYLDDNDKQVRESILEALITIRKPADMIVPALIKTLETHARARLHDASDERIIRGLDEIEARWYDRPEFTENVRQYVNRFPKNID